MHCKYYRYWPAFIDLLGDDSMKPCDIALAHIREAIDSADVLRVKSSAVLVSDLKILLQIADTAIQHEQVQTVVYAVGEPDSKA
jgi:hypothetical protein